MKTLVVVFVVFVLVACSSANVYNNLNAQTPITQPNYDLGVAFGGGGVRGFMHLGVIKALEEAGIRPDVVTGTSAGAIAATLYGSGMDFEDMVAAVDEIGMWDIADFVLSSQGLVNGKRLSRWINAHLAYDDLADMPIPVAVTATNMTAHKTLIIRSGDPGKAVQTSATIPGVFIPVMHNGDILVDGGVLSVVPVYAARALGAKKVIAIDIYCSNQSPPEITASKVTLAVFRMQSCRLSQPEIDSGDIVITPAYEPDGIAAFDDKPAAIEAGYRATQALLPQIKALLVD